MHKNESLYIRIFSQVIIFGDEYKDIDGRHGMRNIVVGIRKE